MRESPHIFAPRKRTLSIVTDWIPHSPEQASILYAEDDEIDATCGRRFGKSSLGRAWLTGIYEGAKWGAIHVRGGRFWYVAPTLKPLCKDFYRGLKKSLGSLVRHKNDTDLELVLFNDTIIECKSAEDADNLRGPGLDGILLDEKGTISAYAWDEVLSPMLADIPERCRRRALKVGSPRGKRHWSYREHLLGVEGPHGAGRGDDRTRSAFRFPTWSRPGMQGYCDSRRKTMPPNSFNQEYGAEFLDSAAGYFDLIPEAHDGCPAPEDPEPGAVYSAGLDFGHVDDWTVVAIVRAQPLPMRVVALLRFAPAAWPITKARALDMFRKWNPAIVTIDATPSGAPSDVITAAFKPEWTRVHGYDFREGGGRESLLQNLAIMLSMGELRLPGTYDRPGFPILTAELDAFSYVIHANGRARGTKGHNMADDTVMAVGLAAWAAKNRVGKNVYGSRKIY